MKNIRLSNDKKRDHQQNTYEQSTGPVILYGTETVSYTHLDVYKRQQKSTSYAIHK